MSHDRELTAQIVASDNDMLPAEILALVFEKLDKLASVPVSSVCKFWQQVNETYNQKSLFKKFFPDLYDHYTNPYYALIMDGLKAPVNWSEKLRHAFGERCVSFTQQQMDDYLVLRALDFKGIKSILESEEGYKRIFLKDACGETVFHFLRQAKNPFRQTILDAIFDVLERRMEIFNLQQGDIIVATDFEEIFGVPLSNILESARNSRTFSISLAIAALCNQTEKVKEIISADEHFHIHKDLFLEIVINFNNEDCYNVLHSESFNNNSVITALLSDICYNLISVFNVILQSNKKLFISQSFADLLFNSMKPFFFNDSEIWSYTAISDLRSDGLFFWACVLNQTRYIQSISAPKSLDILSPLFSKLTLSFRSNTSYAYDFNTYIHALVDKKVHFRMSCHPDYMWRCSLMQHPIAFVIKAGDLVLLNKLCVEKQLNEALKKYALEAAAFMGNLDCMRLLVYHGAVVDKVKITAILNKGEEMRATGFQRCRLSEYTINDILEFVNNELSSRLEYDT